MNDFTKEELQTLLSFPKKINDVCRIMTPEKTPRLLDLEIKLQSMIDNYCEHPENMSLQNMGDEWCVKCKRKIE